MPSNWPRRWLTRGESVRLTRAIMAHQITRLERQERILQLMAQPMPPNEEREACDT